MLNDIRFAKSIVDPKTGDIELHYLDSLGRRFVHYYSVDRARETVSQLQSAINKFDTFQKG